MFFFTRERKAADRKIDGAKYTANLEEDLFEAAKDLRLLTELHLPQQSSN